MQDQKNRFTYTPIPGQPVGKYLPQGVSLVLEGGGTRGFYTAGVLEAFMDAGIMFPYIAGVSAGAANAISYLSGQRLRNRQIIEHFVGDPRYVSIRNFILHRSLFHMKFIFRTIPERHIALDLQTFSECTARFLTGATDCVTGQTVWFEKQELGAHFEGSVASCSVPLLSPVVKYKNYELLDGGLANPIPIEKSLEDGNHFHVIVLTRNEGYRKKAFGHKKLLHLYYRKYPKIAELLLQRHEIYNRQLELCEQLERAGKAVIIRPLEPLRVKRTSADTEKLLALHDEGRREAEKKLQFIPGI